MRCLILILIVFGFPYAAFADGDASASPRAQFTSTATDRARVENGKRLLAFAWPEQSAGPCHLGAASLLLDDDGTGVFQSTASTRDAHAGSVWRVSIDLQDGDGYYLFGAGVFVSPVMQGGDPAPFYEFDHRFAWHEAIVKRVWEDIRRAELHGVC
jgi:hypothetical protein